MSFESRRDGTCSSHTFVTCRTDGITHRWGRYTYAALLSQYPRSLCFQYTRTPANDLQRRAAEALALRASPGITGSLLWNAEASAIIFTFCWSCPPICLSAKPSKFSRPIPHAGSANTELISASRKAMRRSVSAHHNWTLSANTFRTRPHTNSVAISKRNS
jgi:hypothetical protein